MGYKIVRIRYSEYTDTHINPYLWKYCSDFGIKTYLCLCQNAEILILWLVKARKKIQWELMSCFFAIKFYFNAYWLHARD